MSIDTEPNPYETARRIRRNQPIGQGAREVSEGLATTRITRVIADQGPISTRDLEHDLKAGLAKMPAAIRQEIADHLKKQTL